MWKMSTPTKPDVIPSQLGGQNYKVTMINKIERMTNVGSGIVFADFVGDHITVSVSEAQLEKCIFNYAYGHYDTEPAFDIWIALGGKYAPYRILYSVWNEYIDRRKAALAAPPEVDFILVTSTVEASEGEG
jgi:hypothetical protein